MSSVPSTSGSASPITLVRSSEDLGSSNHVPSTFKARTTAITTPVFAHKLVERTSRSFTDTLLYEDKLLGGPENWHNGSQQLADSNEETPRLQPVCNGSHNLPFVPRDNANSLEFVRLPPQRHWASSSNISTLTAGLHTSSKSSPFRSLSTTLSTSYITPYSRTKSYGSLKSFSMAEEATNGTGHIGTGPTLPRDHSPAQAQILSEETRNRSTSRSGKGRVEKRIEASLAEAEPAAHARSRKSSHMMQLFKENRTPTESKASEEKSRKTSRSASDGSVTRETGPVRENSGRERLRDPVAGDDNDSTAQRIHIDQKENAGVNTATGQQPSGESSIRPSRTFSSSGLSDRSSNERGKAIVDRNIDPLEPKTEMSKARTRSRLLEEIRAHHGLGAPVNEKFKTTQPKPVKTDDADADAVPTPIDRKMATESVDIASKSEVDEDLDEDDSEISSAVYYPHQAPSPNASEEILPEERILGIAPSQAVRTLQVATTSLSLDGNESCDVDIALESAKQNRYLHGALQQDQPLFEASLPLKGYSSGISSASESEYSSLTEGETTPKATPSAAKSTFLRSRARKGRRPRAAPKEVVVLKPYQHQVGGHTRIFQFSKKTICKQLNNNENEFYEAVEQSHPELLGFMPR